MVNDGLWINVSVVRRRWRLVLTCAGIGVSLLFEPALLSQQGTA